MVSVNLAYEVQTNLLYTLALLVSNSHSTVKEREKEARHKWFLSVHIIQYFLFSI